MRRLADVLVSDYGLSLTGWTLVEARGVSADGKVIVGYGTNPSGQGESWIANLRVAALSSTPGDGGRLGFGNILVGTTATRSLSVSNSGDLGTTLAGTLPAGSGEFTPGSTQGFSLAQGASTSRDYVYTPTARGSDSLPVIITSDGGIAGQNSTVTLTGTGVAPVSSVLTPTVDFGLVRIGTTKSLDNVPVVRNIGDGNQSGLGALSNLNGTAPALSTEGFSGGGDPFSLPDGGTCYAKYSYDPLNRLIGQTLASATCSNGSPDGTNGAHAFDMEFIGQRVGPVFGSSVPPESMIDFGWVVLGSSATRTLDLSNPTPDPNGGDASLTDLTLLTASIGGLGPEYYSILDFSAGMVIPKGGTFSFTLRFQGNELGAQSGTLTFVTDEGAARGQAGQIYSFDLGGTVFQAGQDIPEPATLLLLAGGLAALARRRKPRGA